MERKSIEVVVGKEKGGFFTINGQCGECFLLHSSNLSSIRATFFRRWELGYRKKAGSWQRLVHETWQHRYATISSQKSLALFFFTSNLLLTDTLILISLIIVVFRSVNEQLNHLKTPSLFNIFKNVSACFYFCKLTFQMRWWMYTRGSARVVSKACDIRTHGTFCKNFFVSFFLLWRQEK